jgi:hypothetical protein
MPSIAHPTHEQLLILHTVIAGVDEAVEITVDANGRVLWINVAGVCVLRITGATNITVVDNRTKTN